MEHFGAIFQLDEMEENYVKTQFVIILFMFIGFSVKFDSATCTSDAKSIFL